MANLKDVRQEQVTIELGGKVRTLKYDMNAFAELEKIYGTIDAAMQSLGGGRLTDIRNVLWAGLIHEEAVLDEHTGEPIRFNVSAYQVGSWVGSPSAMATIGGKIGEAMANGMPDPENMIKQAQAQVASQKAEGVAQVVLTPEEEAAQAEEAKNV